MRRMWTIWKHAIGSFDEEDGYDVNNEDYVAIVRTFIIGLNVLCAFFIITNIIKGW